MAGTIVIGFDDSDGAGRALDHAIAEAKSSGDELVVVAVFEMMFDPEGPQSFGSLNEEAKMMPLVEPPELEPILAKARAKVKSPGFEADYVWAVGNAVGVDHPSTARDRGARLSCWPGTTTASSAGSSAPTSPARSSTSSAHASSSSTDPGCARRSPRPVAPSGSFDEQGYSESTRVVRAA